MEMLEYRLTIKLGTLFDHRIFYNGATLIKFWVLH